MNLVQLTPGAGGLHCGNCFRDNALVAAWRRQGHAALMVPLYLPLDLEEADQSAGTPVFFSGVNVYLEQKVPWFRRVPHWLHAWLAHPRLLGWVGRFAARTQPADVGELTVSMLRGEAGHQAREVEELVQWLKTQARPDVICLSNVMLVGPARRLRQALGVPVVSMLQGEESFLDALPAADRDQAWRTLAERARELEALIAPSRYFADRMIERLGLPADRVHVVPNGISLAGYDSLAPLARRLASGIPPILGYLARLCPEKGLDRLIDAFITLKKRNRVPGLRLRVGGSCTPADRPFLAAMRQRLRRAGWEAEAEFIPNLDRAGKLALLGSLTVFSVPAVYSEAFGLYLLEAMAAGVPVVQPQHAAFPELATETGGGLLYPPSDPDALANTLEELLLDPPRLEALGQAGFQAVRQRFTDDRMAQGMIRVLQGSTRVQAAECARSVLPGSSLAPLPPIPPPLASSRHLFPPQRLE